MVRRGKEICKRAGCMQVSYPLTHRGHVVALAHCPFRSLLLRRLNFSLSFKNICRCSDRDGASFELIESSTPVQITGRDNPETQQTRTPMLNVARINTYRGNPEHSKRYRFICAPAASLAPQNANVLPRSPKPEDLCLGSWEGISTPET